MGTTRIARLMRALQQLKTTIIGARRRGGYTGTARVARLMRALQQSKTTIIGARRHPSPVACLLFRPVRTPARSSVAARPQPPVL
jgi:hypothetical protein